MHKILICTTGICLFCLANIACATEYFIATGGNDNNPGTIDLPFRTFQKGLQTVQNGDTLSIRAGTYRLLEESANSIHFYRPNATENNFVTIQSYNGEKVKILGSLSTEGKVWEQYNTDIYRMATDYLPNNPSGMFNGEKRVDHVMKWVDGSRSNADVLALVTPGTWTKADASGIGCGSINDGCYIYLYPFENEDPNAQTYELSQRKLFHAQGTSYLTIKGLEFAYTQDSALTIEGGRGQLIENNIFSHNSYSNDNSYSIFITYSGGVVVRGNVVFDSEYWGGTPNSKGITFMNMDPDNPSIVEDNELYDIIGQGICTKGGASNLIIRRNYLHEMGVAIEPNEYRCHWTKPDCVAGDPEYYPGGGWKIYENVLVNNNSGVDFYGESNNNFIYNNVFYNNTGAGINMDYGIFGIRIANNIFLENTRAIYLNAGSGGEMRTVEDFLPQFASDNNLFHKNTNDYFLRPNWSGPTGYGTGYTLEQVKSNYSRELESISEDPLFQNVSALDFHIDPSSPAKSAGDGSFYDAGSVDIGIYPNAFYDSEPPAAPNGLSAA